MEGFAALLISSGFGANPRIVSATKFRQLRRADFVIEQYDEVAGEQTWQMIQVILSAWTCLAPYDTNSPPLAAADGRRTISWSNADLCCVFGPNARRGCRPALER